MMKRCWASIITLFLGTTHVSARTDTRRTQNGETGAIGRQDELNPVPEWIDLALHWIGQSERGPT